MILRWCWQRKRHCFLAILLKRCAGWLESRLAHVAVRRRLRRGLFVRTQIACAQRFRHGHPWRYL